MKVLCTAQMGTGTVMGQTMRVVAIAKALQRRGHEVSFIAAAKLIPIINNFGIAVLEASDMPDFSVFASQQNGMDSNKGEFMAEVNGLMEKISRIEFDMAAEIKPHLIVSGTLSGASVARQSGIPSILTFLQPHGERTLNMFKSRVQNQDELTMKQIAEKMLSMLGAADLILLEGMPEISGGVNLESFGQAALGLKEKIRFTGPLLTEYPDQLPERGELKQRHIGNKSSAMAYITIGGGSPLIGSQFLKTVLEARKLIPDVTGVISTGIGISPETVESFDPPANAIVRGFVPGTELIKASDVTVFHGGSSTLMTCIACGTPAVVVPSMGEQEDNGAVLARNGAGIVLEKQSLTPAVLAEAMQNIIRDGKYQISAGKLKALGEKYGGADAAAGWAEQLFTVASK